MFLRCTRAIDLFLFFFFRFPGLLLIFLGLQMFEGRTDAICGVQVPCVARRQFQRSVQYYQVRTGVCVCHSEKKVPDGWQTRQAIPPILQVSSSKHNANKNTTRGRGPFHQSITAILTEVCVCVCACARVCVYVCVCVCVCVSEKDER